jgi:predicted DNA-binding transcriptional regulator AlpA
MPKPLNNPDDPLLSVEDVCRWLGGRSQQWVRRNYPEYFPEVTHVGRKLYWRQSVIAAYLDKNTVGAHQLIS